MRNKLLTWKYVGDYLDTRIDSKARREFIAAHYNWMMEGFVPGPLERSLQDGIPIWRSVDKDGIESSIVMGHSNICPMEGEVEFVFHDDKGRLAFLTFLLVDGARVGAPDGPAILIGGIQGGYGRREDYRSASKRNGEITPINHLYIAAKALAEAIGASALLGMPDEGQIARRYASEIITLNYDRTWTEFGGELTPAGFFSLDFRHRPSGSLDHLSRAHRSRARKKNALKAQLQDDMRQRLSDLFHPIAPKPTG